MFSVLRARNFRLLWFSQSVSLIGDSLVIVAIGLYVTRLTGDATDVGLVLAAYSVPLVLFLLVGGVVADRLPRQAVMVASDLVRAALHGLLAVLIVTGTVRIWHMVAIGIAFGAAEAFFRPAYTGLVPQTLPTDDDIQRAQALGGMTAELATIIGPALATALVVGVGGAAAFAADAATFLLSAALVIRIRARPRGAPGERSTVLRELRQGWGAVRERPWVLWTVVSFSAALVLAMAPYFVLGAATARQVYGTDAVFGLTEAAFGLGTVTGAVVGSRLRPRRPMRLGATVALFWPLTIVLFAVGPPRAVLFVFTACGGVGVGLYAVLWETALAQRIPPQLLSRVSAWDWMGSLALLPLGYIVAGPIGQWLGERPVLIGGGLLGTAAMAAALLPHSTRTLERLPESSSAGQTRDPVRS